MITDEGGYAYVAHFWSSDYELYRDIPFNRLQAIFLLYKTIFLTLGEGVFAFRLFAALYNGATLVVLFWLVRRAYSDSAAIASTAIFAVFSVGPSMEGFTANAEIFAQLPIVASALFTWRRQWAWAGVAAAAAVLMKPSGLSALVLTVGWAFVTGAAVRGTAIAVLTFILGLVPSVLHGIWVGWEFYVGSMIGQRVLFASQGSLSIGTQLDRLGRSTLLTMPSWGIPAVLSLTALSRRFQRPQLFGLLWLGSSVFGMAMGGFWFLHYFIQLMPPLAFLGGAGLLGLGRQRFRWVWTLLLLLVTLPFTRDLLLWTSPPSQISWDLYRRSGYLVATEVADYIAANTSMDESVFIAFSQAEIYYLSRRRAAIPYMYYAYYEYSPDIFDQAVDAIREAEPAIVVVAQPPPSNRMSSDEFENILLNRYELVKEVQPAIATARPLLLYRRKGNS